MGRNVERMPSDDAGDVPFKRRKSKKDLGLQNPVIFDVSEAVESQLDEAEFRGTGVFPLQKQKRTLHKDRGDGGQGKERDEMKKSPDTGKKKSLRKRNLKDSG